MKPRRLLMPFCLAALLLSLPTLAEAPEGRQASPDGASPGRVWTAPAVDVERLMREDEANRHNKEIPWRVGFPMRTDLSPANSGVWADNADGSRTWRLEVQSKRARWLVLGFSRFELRPGAALSLLDESGQRVYGPKTSADVKPHGQLWFPPVEGSRVTVELEWPAELAREQPALHLGTVSHGYREWGSFGKTATATTGSGSCNNDVACPAGIGWENEVRSVVRILSGGFAFCTGALINNSANDCTPYVLTAAHCSVNGPSTTYQFNFQNANCDFGPIVSTTDTLTGSSLLASYSNSDFELFRLDDPIPESFNVFFSGWSRSAAAASRSTGIHHPSGDVKKISHNEDPLINGPGGTGYGNDHWRVTQWEDGTTEPSSSGSPLYDQNHRIVGQLHGGTASCSSNTWDEYGKLSVSWVGGGSTATRLSDWLDPLGSGVTTLDGIDYSYCLMPEPDLHVIGFIVDDSEGNGDGVVDPGETVQVYVELENFGNAGATHIVGSATTSTPQINLAQAALSWPAIPAGETAISSVPVTMTVGTDVLCGSAIALQLTTTAAEEPGTWNDDLDVGTGLSSGIVDAFSDDIENGGESWTTLMQSGTNPWQQSTAQSLSPVTSWYVADIAGVSDAILKLAEFSALPVESELTFSHLMDSEPGFDGGVLEYSTDGVNWNDAGALIAAGGYNLTISTDWGSPIAGRPAWSGNLGFWRNVRLDLAPLAGLDVTFRWRFATDAFLGSGIGWFVDDVRVRYASFECSDLNLVAPGEVSGPGSPDQFLIDSSLAGQFLSWSAPADGGPVDGYRLYAQNLGDSKRNVPVCVGSLGTATSVEMDLPVDRQFMIVAANAAGEGPYGYDSDGVPRTVAAEVCP